MNARKLDQFYTKSEIAKKCIDTVEKLCNFSNYDIILEPSAGCGTFLDLLPIDKRIGLDIDPKLPEIIKQDFLSFIPNKNHTYLIIGNPPFGKNSSLAIKFFNISAEFSSVIAFILPRTFKKASIINKLNDKFNLIYEEQYGT
jgi:predicted RNA methylase